MVPDMLIRMTAIVFCAGALLPAAIAQSFTPTEIQFFRALDQQPNDLARYVYLVKVMPQLAPTERQLAMQMFASTEDELGLYNEAVRDFPLKSHVPAEADLPAAADWKTADAAEVVTRLAAHRRVVMVNEAHHDAHTRQLTLELLPRLRALGFNYFAAEALAGKDHDLMRRGYPIKGSGTEYLHEPLYGDIVREAVRLGFTVVSYDAQGSSVQARETGQAESLYQKVLAKDPGARLFIHAGYAHIDKAKGRLGNVSPMAMELQRLSGIEPLSIDQTQFREQIPSEPDAYTKLVDTFKPDGPTVLLNRADGHPWSAHPQQYDVNVILPPTGMGAVESGYMQPSTIVHNTNRPLGMLTRVVNAQRPEWLTLKDQRYPFAINTGLCKITTPCVIDAHYIGEPDNAPAADRYALLLPDTVGKLYLRPGSYRLRAWDIRGRTLSERTIKVAKP